jgi:flagellin
MVDKISISSSARTNLLSLQGTAELISRTQSRLSSGKAVQGPTDDAVKYFQAKSLSARAQDLGERKDAIDQGVSSLDAALKATDGMEKLLQQVKGKIDAARSQTSAQRKETQNQINTLVSQVQRLVDDASYKGLNLLNSTGSTLNVRFSDKSQSKLDVKGVNFNVSKVFLNSVGAAGPALRASFAGATNVIQLGFQSGLTKYAFSVAADAASFNAKADLAILKLESTITNLRSKAATMATNSDILKIRLDFTKEYTNVLQTGADKLTLADLNEEAAGLLALQTRQQMGIQALSLASQSEQSVLSLFR